MNTTGNLANIVHEAMSCIAFGKDMRKSAVATGRKRQVESAQEAEREALEYIRQAQELLQEIAAEINKNL